jgi:hypothetical protein
VKLERSIETTPPEWLARPPPLSAEFWTKSLSTMVAGPPSMRRPPPSPSSALLAESSTRVRVSPPAEAPLLVTPPPSAALLPEICHVGEDQLAVAARVQAAAVVRDVVETALDAILASAFPALLTAPPSPEATLPDSVVAMTVRSPSPALSMAPPSPSERLPEMVEPMTTSVPRPLLASPAPPDAE